MSRTVSQPVCSPVRVSHRWSRVRRSGTRAGGLNRADTSGTFRQRLRPLLEGNVQQPARVSNPSGRANASFSCAGLNVVVRADGLPAAWIRQALEAAGMRPDVVAYHLHVLAGVYGREPTRYGTRPSVGDRVEALIVARAARRRLTIVPSGTVLASATPRSLRSARRPRRGRWPTCMDDVVHVAGEALVPKRDVAQHIADRPRAVDERIRGGIRRRGAQQPLDSRVEFGEQLGPHGQLQAIRDLRAGVVLVRHGDDLRRSCRGPPVPPAGSRWERRPLLPAMQRPVPRAARVECQMETLIAGSFGSSDSHGQPRADDVGLRSHAAHRARACAVSRPGWGSYRRTAAIATVGDRRCHFLPVRFSQ